MKNLSQLTRTQAPDFFRARKSSVNMIQRKEYRRVKKMNYFARDYTNEQNPNAWFNAKRYKALGLHYQNMRNMHPGTLPISPELKKQISQKFTEDSHWQYWNYRNFMKQYREMQETLQSVDIEAEIKTIPAKLREQIQSLEEIETPEMIRFNFHFSEQWNVSLPLDERHRKNLILRIQNPPKDRSQEEED